jgi:hypothetical protein
MAIDTGKLDEFLGRFVADLGATVVAGSVVIGHRLGLYRALAAGPATAGELAARTGTSARYLAEWLCGQAAGMGWQEHDGDVFAGCEQFFRPGYAAHLVPSWIPALDGVGDKLHAGARVADIGCGHGASTILLARAFPNSAFTGSDYHDRSIETARKRAADAGLDGRVSFEVAAAEAFTGTGYDLAATFDCLHDLGDPLSPRATSGARSPPTAPGSSSSPPPARRSPTTSTRSAASTTPAPPCCASRTPCPSPAATPSAPRPARQRSVSSPPAPASPAFAAPPKHRSTSSTRPAHNPAPNKGKRAT